MRLLGCGGVRGIEIHPESYRWEVREREREFPDVNPADGSVIAQVAEADQDLVDDAVRAAHKALRCEWGRVAIGERAARLHKVADRLIRS